MSGAVSGVLIEHAVLVGVGPDHAPISPGYLLIRDGRIAAVGAGEYPGPRHGLQARDAGGRIVMPGLVDAHHHSYGNLLKGHIQAAPLELYFLYVLAEAPRITPEDAAIACTLGAIELLESGCTAILDHLTQTGEGLAAAADAYRRIGIRVLLTPQIADLPPADSLPAAFAAAASGLRRMGAGPSRPPTELLAEVEAIIRTCHRPDDGVQVAVGPSAPVRCSDGFLVGAFELARRYGVLWHTHLLESRAQARRAAERYGRSMVSHLHALGLLGPRVSLAHVVWASDDDLEIIRASGATVIHVPVANLQLGDGIMPFPAIRRRGIPVALGTDSAACAGGQSMFEVMKLAAILGRVTDPDPRSWPTAPDALQAATLGGAGAVGLEDQIGSLEAGKSADLVILRRDHPALIPLHDPVAQVVFGRPESAVDEVWVRGRRLVADGRVVGLDRDGLLAEAAARGTHLLHRCRDDYEEIRRQAPAFAAAAAALGRAQV